MDPRAALPGSQPHRLPPSQHPPGGTGSNAGTYRRRSHSQPPAPGLSHDAPQDQFDFEAFLQQVPGGPDAYDNNLFAHLSAMSDEQHRQLPTVPPPSSAFPPPLLPVIPPGPPQMQQGQGGTPNPLLTQTFLAWLQYMHLQNQLNHHSPPEQQTQQPQQYPRPPFGTQSAYPPTLQLHSPSPTPQAGPSLQRQRSQSTTLPPTVIETPGSVSIDGEPDQVMIAEDKRRRNTAASARFRVKKKQWTLDLERTISDLSGRVEELERKASELRRENGWLKEIVMLKSKRFSQSSSNSAEPGPAQRSEEQHQENVDRENKSGETHEADGNPTLAQDGVDTNNSQNVL